MTLEAFKPLHLFLLGEIGLIGLFFHLLPRVTRPEIYFAVTVPRDFRDTNEGLGVLRRYRIQVWLHTLIAVVLVGTGIWTNIPAAVLVGIFWQVIGSFVAFYRGRRVVLPNAAAPTPVREAELAPRRERLPGGLLLQFGPFAILAAVALYLQSRWAEIPARFPVHWRLDGTPDRWAGRTVLGVFGSLLIVAVICASLVIISYGILHWSRRVRASGPWAGREARFRHIILSLFLGCEYFLALTSTWAGLLPLLAKEKGTAPGLGLYLLGATAFVAVMVLILIRTGQGGTRLPDFVESSAELAERALPVGDRTPDQCWKAGLFYVNPDDPALFVETRFGVGYTLNFGHAWSWLILGTIVVVPLVLALLLTASR